MQDRYLLVDVFRDFWTGNGSPTEITIKNFPHPISEHTQAIYSLN